MRGKLTGPDLHAGIARMHARIDALRESLNAADRVLGDGDTGMTVAAVVEAWSTVPESADVGAMLEALGRAGRRATGSSLGAVLATALVAAGKQCAGATSLDAARLAAAAGAGIEAIEARSGATPGDKSILDSLLAVRDAVASATPDASLAIVCLAATESALAQFRARPARIGRARMYGEKGVGHDDPGMLAARGLLRAALDA